MNPNLTFAVLIPNFLAHHSQTPNDLSSKKKTVFCKSFMTSIASFLHRKIDIFYENNDIEKALTEPVNRKLFLPALLAFSIDESPYYLQFLYSLVAELPTP